MPPADGVYAVTSGHRKIWMFVHNRLKITRWPLCSASLSHDHEWRLPY
jgi:hypothetical protein